MYDKWKDVGADLSDDEDTATSETPEEIAKRDPKRAGMLLIQQQAMAQVVGWLGVSSPELTTPDVAPLVRYVAAGDRVICSDVPKRAKAIATFLASEPLPQHAERTLLKLCHLAEKESNEKGCSADERALRTRAFQLCMDALNHLGACKDEETADAVATELASRPNGQFATRYNGYVYATALIRAEQRRQGVTAASDDQAEALDGATLAKAQDMTPRCSQDITAPPTAGTVDRSNWLRFIARQGGCVVIVLAFLWRYVNDNWGSATAQQHA
jgi:hypothetical protein